MTSKSTHESKTKAAETTLDAMVTSAQTTLDSAIASNDATYDKAVAAAKATYAAGPQDEAATTPIDLDNDPAFQSLLTSTQ